MLFIFSNKLFKYIDIFSQTILNLFFLYENKTMKILIFFLLLDNNILLLKLKFLFKEIIDDNAIIACINIYCVIGFLRIFFSLLSNKYILIKKI